MRNLVTRVGILAAVLIVLLAAGTLGFVTLESLPPFDAFYFTIITIATVGYGDIAPVTVGGRILSLFLIITGVGTFTALLVNSGAVFFERRSNKNRIERMNLLIGLFFSVLGNRLLELYLKADPSVNTIREYVLPITGWTDREYSQCLKFMQRYAYGIDTARVDLSQLRTLLDEKTDLLVSLLENPSLLAHELFTALLRATFHLREELLLREDIAACSANDLDHLGNDIKRVYRMLSMIWVRHVYSLKKRYPYLFSLEARNNPFNDKRCVAIE